MRSIAESAEAKGRARALLMALLAIVLVINSSLGIGDPGLIDAPARGWAWLLNIALAVALLVTGGGLMLNAGMRALLNDELVRLHRARALATGYFAAMLVAAVLYVLAWSVPLELGSALRLVMGLATAAALARFALLEWAE